MTKAEIRRNRNKRIRQLKGRIHFGEAKKMSLSKDEGGTGYYYTTITRLLNEDDSFWSDRVFSAIEGWLNARDQQLTETVNN